MSIYLAGRRSPRRSLFRLAILPSLIFLYTVSASCSAGAAVDSDSAASDVGSNSLSRLQTKSNAKITNQFSVGFEYGYFTYREPGLMTDQGSFGGVTGRYDLRTVKLPLHFAVEGDLLVGELNYTGEQWDGTPLNDTTQDLMFDMRVLGGVDLKGGAYDMMYSPILSPYVGLGIRYLNDNGQSSSSYEREITYYYVPIGARLEFSIDSRASFGISAEYDYFLSGVVQTHLSQVNSSYPDLTNIQSSGEGYRFAIDFEYQFTRYGLRVEPYWQHWDIDNSDVQAISPTQTGLEPANSTDQIGLNVTLRL